MRVFALIVFLQYRAQFGQWHRAAEQVALNEVAARALKKLVLLQAFDAFGDHLQMQGVRHDDDRLELLTAESGPGRAGQ